METRVEIEYTSNGRAYVTTHTHDGHQKISRRFSRELVPRDFETIDSMLESGKVIHREDNTEYVLPFESTQLDTLLSYKPKW